MQLPAVEILDERQIPIVIVPVPDVVDSASPAIVQDVLDAVPAALQVIGGVVAQCSALVASFQGHDIAGPVVRDVRNVVVGRGLPSGTRNPERIIGGGELIGCIIGELFYSLKLIVGESYVITSIIVSESRNTKCFKFLNSYES